MGMIKERDLPDGWREVKLSEILETLENGNRPKGGIKEIKNGIPSFGGEHLNSNGGFNFHKIKLIPKDYYHSLRRGKIRIEDVLVVKDGATTGKTSFVSIDFPYQEASVNEHVFILRGNNDIIFQKFLFYHLFSTTGQRQIDANFHGAAIGGINTQFVKNYSLVLPPLPTQKKIVAILDKVEKLKGWRREADELTDELLKSTFLEMFYKNNPDYFNWEFVAIKDLTSQEKGSLRTGPFGSDLKHSEFVDSGIAVLGIDNVVNNRFQWGQRRYITKEKYDGLKRYTVHPNDILISIMATIGKSCVVPDDIPLSISTKHLAVITSDRTKCDPQFLSHSILFHPEIKQQLTKANIGAIMDGLNLKIIKSLKIPLPPLSLQHKFTEILKNVESVRQNQNQSQQKINNLFNALMQQAFRGELS